MKTLLPSADLFDLEAITYQAGRFMIRLRTRRCQAACPTCQTPSNKIHSRYSRHLADLPRAGIPVQFDLQVRKFFCRNDACQQRIFCERVPEIALVYARQTVRLNEYLQQCGWHLGGELSVRLTTLTGIRLGADAMLQRVRKMTKKLVPRQVRVLGVDDFAFRRGDHYGTILVDHERHRVVDLLPSRDAQELADWLRAHPEVEIITRDRAPAYAEGARRGAPKAQQIADRWHLVHNLTEAYEQLIQHHQAAIRECAKELNEQLCAAAATVPVEREEPIVPPTASEYMYSHAKQAARQDFHKHRKARYDEIKRLQHEGRSILGTARFVGMSYMAVKRFYEAPTYPVINRVRYGSQLDRFRPYLQRRWDEGCRNAKQLYRELQSQGYKGSAVTVRRFLIPWRSNDPTAPVPLPIPKWRTPSPQECLWWVLKDEKKLTEEQRQFRTLLLAKSAPIRQGREIVQEFRTVLAKRQAAALTEWEAKVRDSELKEFGTFLLGLARDRVAVENAITQSWSNGPTEGQVNRLKNIKRSMFGRANFDLFT